MRKAGYTNLAAGLALLVFAVILFRPPTPSLGPGVLEYEKVFISGLHNSLYYLDQAKYHWAEEKQKSESDTPTLEDLTPYLGSWTNGIKRFTALGIDYKITSMAKHQSDVATLTRDLRFLRGNCHFYPAGASYCLHDRWNHSQCSTVSRFRFLYYNSPPLLAAASCGLDIANLFVFEKKRRRNSKQASSRNEST